MNKEIIQRLQKSFEDCSHTKDGIEYWLARELQILLDYDEWRNFLKVIEKAKIACEKSGQSLSDHFVEVNKTILMPKGGTKEIDDLMLTRYACYLIAQNGDPRKDQISFAQSYFALQTRKQELIGQRISLIERMNARQKLTASETELTNLIYEKGVNEDE